MSSPAAFAKQADPTAAFAALAGTTPTYTTVAPSLSAPPLSVPSLSAPPLSVSLLSGPATSAPVLSAPATSAPVLSAPVHSAPVLSAPVYTTPVVAALSDRELLDAQRTLAEIRRRVDASSAAVAAEIAHRSRRELGSEGLAQRHGARTPELLVQHVTGSSAREAHTMVRVGALISVTSPLDAVGSAVADGRLSLDAADAIRTGLGSVDEAVPAGSVSEAAESLLHDATVLTVEKLAARARECGAELDEQHVQDRERALRDARYLRLTPLGDGMTRLSGLLDPESAAIVAAAYDGATSPRRGGPRFVDPAEVDRAERLARDERTTEQIAVDSFVELIRIGATAAPDVVGAQRPAVRVLVTDRDLARRAGYALIEGQSTPISIATVEREICDRGAVPIHFDTDGQVVNIGRDQRLFTPRQRIGLAARDGGCRFPGCDRPPSWCEAHHINEWFRDHGRTDIADGILLCRHHHLLIHDNGWRVTRTGADYLLVPPRSLDAAQTPISAPAKTGIVRRLLDGDRKVPTGVTSTSSPIARP